MKHFYRVQLRNVPVDAAPVLVVFLNQSFTEQILECLFYTRLWDYSGDGHNSQGSQSSEGYSKQLWFSEKDAAAVRYYEGDFGKVDFSEVGMESKIAVDWEVNVKWGSEIGTLGRKEWEGIPRGWVLGDWESHVVFISWEYLYPMKNQSLRDERLKI